MQIGIIGLPNSGKTTIFNALTGSETATRAFSSGQLEVHTAVVEVPDPRVKKLSSMFSPRKTTFAQVTFNDIAGIEHGSAKSGFSGPLLNAIAANDALMLVVRAFDDDNVPAVGGTIDPARDMQAMETELILNDMTILDRRIERLVSDKNRGSLVERQELLKEEATLARLMAILEQEIPLRAAHLSEHEKKQIGGFALLSLKPIFRVVNVADDNADEYSALVDDYTLVVCGRLEAEIVRMESDDAKDFLHEYGIAEPSLNRAIRMCYKLLGLDSFFTVGEDEVRAWTIRRGAFAPQAAGIIHSDLQKGFIRAETVAYEDLIAAGNLAEARKQGRLRLEGKDYVVADGDVMNIRFNV